MERTPMCYTAKRKQTPLRMRRTVRLPFEKVAQPYLPSSFFEKHMLVAGSLGTLLGMYAPQHLNVLSTLLMTQTWRQSAIMKGGARCVAL